jgi:mono/diheme cytochrome c family protein
MAAWPRRSRGVLAALLLFALAAIVGAGVLGWAIGQAGEEEAATVTTTVARGTSTEPPGERPAGAARRGREAYLAAGCGACHGQNAEGTDVAPSLAGHTAEQVRQQVRSPLAQMPAYPVEQLSATSRRSPATSPA